MKTSQINTETALHMTFLIYLRIRVWRIYIQQININCNIDFRAILAVKMFVGHKRGERALLFHNERNEMCKMQQILINLTLGQSLPTYLIFTSKCNVTTHVDAYASVYMCLQCDKRETRVWTFCLFYWYIPHCLQRNVFTFCRNWWLWCHRHWKMHCAKSPDAQDDRICSYYMLKLKTYFVVQVSHIVGALNGISLQDSAAHPGFGSCSSWRSLTCWACLGRSCPHLEVLDSWAVSWGTVDSSCPLGHIDSANTGLWKGEIQSQKYHYSNFCLYSKTHL